MRRRRDVVGFCWHCGRKDAPLTDDGYLERHRRADWDKSSSPGNELCNGGAWGGGHLRPGEPCNHGLVPNEHCAGGKVAS